MFKFHFQVGALQKKKKKKKSCRLMFSTTKMS